MTRLTSTPASRRARTSPDAATARPPTEATPASSLVANSTFTAGLLSARRQLGGPRRVGAGAGARQRGDGDRSAESGGPLVVVEAVERGPVRHARPPQVGEKAAA